MNLLQALADACPRPKPKDALRLGEIAKKLRAAYTEVIADPKTAELSRIVFDFALLPPAYLTIYHGDFADFAIVPAFGGAQRTERFVNEVEKALGVAFIEDKGGDFAMYEDTMVWVASDASHASSTYITDVVIHLGYLIVLVTKTDFNEY